MEVDGLFCCYSNSAPSCCVRQTGSISPAASHHFTQTALWRHTMSPAALCVYLLYHEGALGGRQKYSKSSRCDITAADRLLLIKMNDTCFTGRHYKNKKKTIEIQTNISHREGGNRTGLHTHREDSSLTELRWRNKSCFSHMKVKDLQMWQHHLRRHHAPTPFLLE